MAQANCIWLTSILAHHLLNDNSMNSLHDSSTITYIDNIPYS